MDWGHSPFRVSERDCPQSIAQARYVRRSIRLRPGEHVFFASQDGAEWTARDDRPRSRTAGVNGYLRATEYSTVTTAFTTFSTVLVS